jgi:hypothetical protein
LNRRVVNSKTAPLGPCHNRRAITLRDSNKQIDCSSDRYGTQREETDEEIAREEKAANNEEGGSEEKKE